MSSSCVVSILWVSPLLHGYYNASASVVCFWSLLTFSLQFRAVSLLVICCILLFVLKKEEKEERIIYASTVILCAVLILFDYRNVGLLRYYTVKQIPNFVLAAPIVVLSVCGVCSYLFNFNCVSLKKRLTTSYRTQQQSQSQQQPQPQQKRTTSQRCIVRSTEFSQETLTPKMRSEYFAFEVGVYIVHWTFLLLFACLVMHIQVTTRFLCSQVAPLYWFIAHLFIHPPSRCVLIPRLIWLYLFAFNVIGTLLFTTFYPWT